MSLKLVAAFLSGMSMALPFGWVLGYMYPDVPLLAIGLLSLFGVFCSYVFDKA